MVVSYLKTCCSLTSPPLRFAFCQTYRWNHWRSRIYALVAHGCHKPFLSPINMCW